MYAGKIIEYGDVETIFSRSIHPYTWGLISSIPRVSERRKRLYSIKGNPISVIDIPKGCSFNTRCEHAMKICFNEEPKLNKVNGNHKCACFLNKEQVRKIKKEKESVVS